MMSIANTKYVTTKGRTSQKYCVKKIRKAIIIASEIKKYNQYFLVDLVVSIRIKFEQNYRLQLYDTIIVLALSPFINIGMFLSIFAVNKN